MTHTTTISALLGLAIGSATIGGCTVATDESSEGVAQASQALITDKCPADVPAAVVPAADQSIKSIRSAVGVQIYMCNATATGYAWTFVAPQANLLTQKGNLVGTHFIGPTWQGNDGSSVVGTKLAGATVDASAIPWLLLSGNSASVEGSFSGVSSIQRLNTVGGLAPSTGCDADHLGAIFQAPYSADYVFYKTKTEGPVKQCAGG